MGRRFAELMFTPGVKAEQEKHGSREQYARVEEAGRAGDALGPDEAAFVEERDGFYLGSVTETGWPYIQYRGGEKGFLRVVDERTLGFADLRGNRQYISTANLRHDGRVALFLMDYARQARLKIMGRAEIYEGDEAAREWMDKLRVKGERTPAERAIVIRVEAWDWNCQQHITQRFTEAELKEALAPMRERLERLEAETTRLEAENAKLRAGA